MNEQLFSYFVDKFDAFLSFSEKIQLPKFIAESSGRLEMVFHQKFITGVVFMDLSKAFDCLPRSSLIAKLHAYDADLFPSERLVYYASHCLQRVKIGTAQSSWTELTKGIAQGSILGQLVFGIFVNGPFLFIECTF